MQAVFYSLTSDLIDTWYLLRPFTFSIWSRPTDWPTDIFEKKKLFCYDERYDVHSNIFFIFILNCKHCFSKCSFLTLDASFNLYYRENGAFFSAFSSIHVHVDFEPRLLVSSLYGNHAEEPGLLFPNSLCSLFLKFSYFSIWPIEPK